MKDGKGLANETKIIKKLKKSSRYSQDFYKKIL